MGRNEEGFGFVVSGLGLAAGLSVLMFDWPVSEDDTIIRIVIFPIPPSLLPTSTDPSSASVLTRNPN